MPLLRALWSWCCDRFCQICVPTYGDNMCRSPSVWFGNHLGNRRHPARVVLQTASHGLDRAHRNLDNQRWCSACPSCLTAAESTKFVMCSDSVRGQTVSTQGRRVPLKNLPGPFIQSFRRGVRHAQLFQRDGQDGRPKNSSCRRPQQRACFGAQGSSLSFTTPRVFG